jgi:hypothetical protein
MSNASMGAAAEISGDQPRERSRFNELLHQEVMSTTIYVRQPLLRTRPVAPGVGGAARLDYLARNQKLFAR